VPIVEISEGRARNKVVFIGEPPPKEVVEFFDGFDYKLEPFSPADLNKAGALALVDSVVISQDATQPSRILRELELCASSFLNNDCRIYVRPATGPRIEVVSRRMVVNAIDTLELPPAGLSDEEEKSLGDWYKSVQKSPLTPFVYVCKLAEADWHSIARRIRNNPSGPAPNMDLTVNTYDKRGQNIPLLGCEELLIRRAFWDCAVLQMEQMREGLSGVAAYRVYAELAKGNPGLSPYLYFLKIGDRQKITTEFDNYRSNALEYVPFHLGPRLRPGRCCLGAHQGVLVGDFVNNAELLRDAARDGRATHAIANLFNVTLHAWEQLGAVEDYSIQDRYAKDFPESVPTRCTKRFASHGIAPDLASVKRLFMECATRGLLAGPIHGDLNANNILVRSADAILIDFEKMASGGPLLFDAASLEAALLVEGFGRDKRDFDVWKASIEPLYVSGVFLDDRLPRCRVSDPSKWFYDCVRQIRQHARQLEARPGQYAVMLAMILIRKSCNDHNFDTEHEKNERHRAAAYVFGKQILVACHQRLNPPPNDAES